MAVSLLSHEVSDLCIGKPPVRSLPLTASVGAALAALKRSPESDLCILAADKSVSEKRAVGVADVICYLCSSEDNLFDPASALNKPISDLLLQKKPTGAGGATIRQIEASARWVTIHMLYDFNFSD
jgi:hypothetical protein